MDYEALDSNMTGPGNIRFDQGKSTKGASKLRRDLINAEIANLRDLLPLPPSTRQRLSQLQLMALVCVYVRKSNYFQQGDKTEYNKRFVTIFFGNEILMETIAPRGGPVVLSDTFQLDPANSACGSPFSGIY
ncbi:jg21483 [Pararge aegeria aegeria]|uniref:Jg21483 protein n=1 Tax=Pararge aegeria aegeria TaxID=348720 RepID=A0A8S4RN33_9NEOP|nr:jg21483 [Pararge aegeria aegeria]